MLVQSGKCTLLLPWHAKKKRFIKQWNILGASQKFNRLENITIYQIARLGKIAFKRRQYNDRECKHEHEFGHSKNKVMPLRLKLSKSNQFHKTNRCLMGKLTTRGFAELWWFLPNINIIADTICYVMNRQRIPNGFHLENRLSIN